VYVAIVPGSLRWTIDIGMVATIIFLTVILSAFWQFEGTTSDILNDKNTYKKAIKCNCEAKELKASVTLHSCTASKISGKFELQIRNYGNLTVFNENSSEKIEKKKKDDMIGFSIANHNSV